MDGGAGRAGAAAAQSLARKSSAVMGDEKRPNVPSVAPLWPSADVVAQQSVSVIVLKPFSKAVRIVDSTQQFVKKPQRTTVSILCALSCASRSVPGNASRPFLPLMTTSPAAGAISLTNSEFHVSLRNSFPSKQP